MPRFAVTQRRKAEKEQTRRWDLPAGSHVWVYLRHSPGDNQTIDSQVAGVQAWCDENEWIIDRWFIDEAVEGSREDRVQFQEMITLSRQEIKHVDGIALWSFSRFARDQIDAQFYKAELRKRGYVIVSKIDDVPSGEMGPIYEAFIDWKNQRFLEDLSADVKRGLTFDVERGYWPGGNPPVGYRTEKETIGRKRNGDQRMAGRLVKNESCADRVALAWKMKIQDNASYLQIHEATHLYSDPKHYNGFFNNLLYAGIFVYHGKRFPVTWEEGATFCEPYITLQDYLKVQQGRQRRNPAVISPRIMASTYLLTGLVYCGLCSQDQQQMRLTGQTDPRKRGTQVYRCSTKIRSRGHDCQLPRVPCWRLDDAVIQLLKQYVLTPDYVAAEVEEANKLLAEQNDISKTALPEAERLAKVAQKKVEGIVDLIGKKGVTPILEKQYDEANRQWLAATANVSTMRSQAATTRKQHLTVIEAERILDEMLTTMDEGTIKERQGLVAHFIERVVVFPDQVEVYFRFRPEGKLIPFRHDWQADIQTNTQDSEVRSPGQVYSGCPHGGSNAGLWLRRPSLCPLSYRGMGMMSAIICCLVYHR